jgi:hypothetical protein
MSNLVDISYGQFKNAICIAGAGLESAIAGDDQEGAA